MNMFSPAFQMKVAINSARLGQRPCFYFNERYLSGADGRIHAKYNHLWFNAPPELLLELVQEKERLIGVQVEGPKSIDLFLQMLGEDRLNAYLSRLEM